MRREQSFERYYLRNIAIGEGCGCAEELLRTRNPRLRPGPGLRELLAALRARLAGRRSPANRTPPP